MIQIHIKRYTVHFPSLCFFFFNDTATTEIYTLSLHDALPIWGRPHRSRPSAGSFPTASICPRSEEHTSELQSRFDLVCRLLLEKKKVTNQQFLFKKKKNISTNRNESQRS